jgi:hypothetical protein
MQTLACSAETPFCQAAPVSVRLTQQNFHSNYRDAIEYVTALLEFALG